MGSRLFHSSVPLHYQFQRILRAKIASGEWDARERIPTEWDLVRRFEVSRTTIRQALTTLQAEGLIVRTPRRGTFVNASHGAERHRTVITNAVMGYEAEIRLATLEETRAPRQVLPFLQLAPGDTICRFLRLEAIGGMPFCVVVNYLPVQIGRRLSVRQLERRSMMELLQSRLRIRLGRMEQSLEAQLPDEEGAALLTIDVTQPVLFSRLFVSDVRRMPTQVVEAFY